MAASIKNISIDWMERWANSPRIIVELDQDMPSWPAVDTPVWMRQDGFHIAYCGIVAFYFHTDGRPTEGFGGRLFEGTFVNDNKYSYRGAWSSRAACINGLTEFPKIVDVVIGNCATAVTAQAIIDFYKKNRDTLPFGLAWVDTGDTGPTLEATREGKTKNNKGDILIHIKRI